MPSLFHHRSKKDQTPNSPIPNNAAEQSTMNAEAVPRNLTLRRNDSAEPGLWQQAWEEIKDDLVEKLPPEFERLDTFTMRSEVQYVQEEAQSRRDSAEQNERKAFGSRHTYRKICDKVAKSAQKFQIVGDMVAQSEPVYAALPWAFLRFVISCAVGESETYHNMLGGTELVSDLILQYPVIEQLYARLDSKNSNILSKSLLKFYKLILQFQVHAIRYFDPNRKVIRAIQGLNPVTADSIKDRCQAIERARHGVDSNLNLVVSEVTKVGIDNIKESQAGQAMQLEAIKSGVKALSEETETLILEVDSRQSERNRILIEMWKEPLDDLKANFEAERIQREKENLYDIRSWLSVAEPETNLSEAKEKRKPLLGFWLLQNEKFKDWRSSKNSAFLWVYGFAGTGKTGLVCRVLDYIRETPRSEESGEEAARLAFFYCSNDQASSGREQIFSRSDPEEALRSVVSQLCTSQNGRSVAPTLQRKYNLFGRHSDHYRKLNYADCVDILITVSQYTPITIVIDAFDECDQYRSPELIKHLKYVVDQSPKNVKIFISTRSFSAIANELTSNQSIEVTADQNGEDVRYFIQDSLEARIKDGSLLNGEISDDLKAEIEKTLISRAANMFQYANLLLNRLCDKNHNDDEQSIRRKLSDLPKSLTDVYSAIMSEIHDNKNNSERSCLIAQRTLKWLLGAQEQPPGCDVLIEAVSPPERRADHKEILDACRTLVVQKKDVFEFAHLTVREHIGQMNEYNASQCHLVATKSCLQILNTTFGTETPRSHLSDSQKSFEHYALLYWPLHYEGIQQDDAIEQGATINAMLRTFLIQGRSKTNKYKDWYTQAQQNVQQSREQKYLIAKLHALQASPLTPLFAACVFGLEDLVAKFGRELDGLNKYNDHGQSALCLAIENNKLEVVKALLSRRFPADVNLLNANAVKQFIEWDPANPPKTILYASAMQCAAATGRLEIAKFLISQGAHIDLVAGYYGSPLQAAALEGDSAMVELLLRSGAEPNSQGGIHGNALQAAASKGHNNIITLLLENKPPALVSTPGGQYGSALSAAVYSGSTDTVFALLEENADPSERDKANLTPLDKAANMGFADIVKDLLEYKAEADLSPKGDNVHILHRAAMFDMQELVEHCLDQGCNINMVTTKGPRYPRRFNDFPDGMTPLAYACAGGHVSMAELLLKRGAAIEPNKDPSAVLWTAAYQGHAAVVDLLLRWFKERHNVEETARFMDQRPHPKAGHWIMFAAASSVNPDVVSTLLDHGAEYRSNWFDATPLLATATFACQDICKRLLEYSRDGKVDLKINQRAKNGRTAIYEAFAMAQHNIAEQLLDAGADYLIPDYGNATTLHQACCQEYFRLVSSLVKKASEDLNRPRFLEFINTRHSSGRTALIDCAERNHLPHLNLLLDHGADYTIPGNAGSTPLHWASRLGHDGIVVALLRKAQREDDGTRPYLDFVNHRNKDGKTAFIEAVREDRRSIIQILLCHGADCSITDNADISALHVASNRGFKEVVDVILKHATIELDQKSLTKLLNLRNNQGKTALIDAAETDRPRIFKALLDHGADYAIVSKSGTTALHFASHRGHFDIVAKLMEHASRDPNTERFREFLDYRNNEGKTALMDATETDRPRIMQMLLDYGADWSTGSKSETTVLHFSSWNGVMNGITKFLAHASHNASANDFKLFLNHRNSDGKTALVDAAQTNRPEIIKVLLDHGSDYSIGDKNGFTALHYSAFRRHMPSVRMLLEQTSHDQADDGNKFKRFLNQQSTTNKATALSDAASQGHTDIAILLLSYGADYHCPDDKKRTPLHHAINKGDTRLALELLEYAGRDVDKQRFKTFISTKSEAGMTAWDRAIKTENQRVVEALRERGAVDGA